MIKKFFQNYKSCLKILYRKAKNFITKKSLKVFPLDTQERELLFGKALPIYDLYRKYLKRKPENVILENYLAKLDSADISINDIEHLIESSEESKVLQKSRQDSLDYIDKVLGKDIKDVYYLFNKVFERDPDVEGLIKCIDSLSDGNGLENLERELNESPEAFFSETKEEELKEINNKNMIKLRNQVTHGMKDNSWGKFRIPAILISTNTECSRFKATSKHLKNLEINYELEEGILPNKIREHIIESNGVLYGQVNYNNVRLTASFISHINALRKIYNKIESDIYLVMEDDVRLFPEPYLIGLDNILNNFDWDVLQIEAYYNDNEINDEFLYSTGITCRRWERSFDIGAGAYFIKRKFIKKIIDYLFIQTEKGMKIDLEKTYLQTYGIAADSFLYMFGNTLKLTFPIAQQSLEHDSEIGYPDEHTRKRLITELSTYKKWTQNYNYKDF